MFTSPFRVISGVFSATQNDRSPSMISQHGFTPLNHGARFIAACALMKPGSEPPASIIILKIRESWYFVGF